MSTNEVSRRGFMTAAAGSAAAAAASGTAAAQQTVPDYGSFLGDANLYEEGSAQDLRDQSEVTVSVGAGDGLAFDPPAIWISPGTTVTWEWTGEGGSHNVVAEEGPAGIDSGDPIGEEGHTYSYEFTEEDAGITNYKCEPHVSQGMKGGVAVGDDVPTKELAQNEGPAITIPDQALALTVATMFAMVTTLGLGYFFMKYGGDYETD
ncbi:MAG: halocyanin-like protein [Natronomonas sp.]|jgi:halocyanin-like protein|uniref:halocyanin domain-containing protein n=1 Tax=Natronomonas sp. TaxID=2184060 RepID=UPI0039890920